MQSLLRTFQRHFRPLLDKKQQKLKLSTHSRAHHVSQTKVKSALLIHGVVNPWQLWKGRPVVFEGIIPQTIVGTATGKNYRNRWGCEACTVFVVSLPFCSKQNRAYDFSDAGPEEQLLLQLCSHSL